MRNLPQNFAIFFVVGVLGTKALAQPAVPQAPHFDFENGAGGWIVLGEGGKVSSTSEPGTFKGGKSALQFEYNVKLNNFTALLAPVEKGALATCTSVHFWIKSPTATPMAFAIQERDGGRYTSFFTTPADSWQEVSIRPSDMALLRNPDDPVDPDGKLDLDQVEALGFLDMSQIFVGNNEYNPFHIKAGPRKFYLDDLEVVTEAVKTAPAADVLDEISTPQPQWLGVGSLSLSVVSDKPLPARSMEWETVTSANSISALLKMLPRGALAKASKLQFQAAATSDAQLIVAIETPDGGKYNLPFSVKGGENPEDVEINLAELRPADDNKSPRQTLDRSQAKQIIFADITGMATGATQSNTIWIGPVSLKGE